MDTNLIVQLAYSFSFSATLEENEFNIYFPNLLPHFNNNNNQLYLTKVTRDSTSTE